jgi:hypothetical protein
MEAAFQQIQTQKQRTSSIDRIEKNASPGQQRLADLRRDVDI